MRAGNVRREQRLAAKVQAVNVRSQFRDRAVVDMDIVNEQRPAGAIFGNDLLQRRTLRPLIGEDAQVQAVGCQLIGARQVELVLQVGQHHHIRLAPDLANRLQGSGNRVLPIHLGFEKAVEM